MILLTSSIAISSVADTGKKKIKYSHKNFLDYLNNRWKIYIFIQPADIEKIANIIPTLSMNESSGPNSILYKILHLLKKRYFKQLPDLFNLPLSSGVFPSLLKIAKVVPVYKKHSNLDCHNYRSISLLFKIEKLMYKRVYQFLTENNIIHGLQFGFRQNFSTTHALINLTENRLLMKDILDVKYL